MDWVDQAITALSAHSDLPTYVNYLASDDASDIQASYGGNYTRLAGLKSHWDPDNVFNQNRNIRP